jgi:hypothetical protein
MSEYQTRLTEIERDNQRSIVWKQTILWSCGGAAILLLILTSATIFIFQAELTPITIGLLLGGATIVLFLILAVWGNTLSQIALMRRDSALMELRFDVHAAVESALGNMLSRHLPQYKRLQTELDVGEELLRHASLISRRQANLAQKIQSLYAGKSLAEAVDMMVRDSLLAHGQAADNATVAQFLERFDTNVVPLRTPGE